MRDSQLVKKFTSTTAAAVPAKVNHQLKKLGHNEKIIVIDQMF